MNGDPSGSGMENTVITIAHSREDGTLVYGTSCNDGAGSILRAGGFRPSRNLPDGAYWYLPHSRDRSAKTWKIQAAADALQAAGFTVELEIDNVTAASTSFAEREAERGARAEDRALRYQERADRAGATGERMWEEARQQREAIPLGQPLLVDHYSYRADRNRRDRMHRKEGRAIQEMRRGEYWAERGQAAENYRQHREDVPTTLRRIEKLEARQRQIDRELEGFTEWCDPDQVDARIAELAKQGIQAAKIRSGSRYGVLLKVPIGTERKAELEAELAGLAEEIGYWREQVAQAEVGGVKVWRREDVAKGGFVRNSRGGVWLEITRVNAKSVTVPWAILGVGAEVWTVADVTASGRGMREDGKPYTDTIPYHKVIGYLSPAEARRRWPQKFTQQAGGTL